MYDTLYEIWKQELQNAELGELPEGFYPKVAGYLGKLREESRMLDKRTIKARLLKSEIRNVKRMICEIIQTRYRKSLIKATADESVSKELLTVEEEAFLRRVFSLADAYRTFTKSILQGNLLQHAVVQEQENTVMRFLKDVPAIIGVNMKLYGPFKPEDIASLPTENAKILVKQGLAEKVEIN